MPINLHHNFLLREEVEFVLVDFGSKDGLREWILTHFRNELYCGYLKYFYTDSLPDWHASIAKNIAHYYSTGQILVNLDCDNYTGEEGSLFVIKQFDKFGDKLLLHQWSEDWYDGSFGRIGMKRKYFFDIGGYDETFLPMGHQDTNLLLRLSLYGLLYKLIGNSKYNKALYNTKEESIRYTNSELTYSEMRKKNQDLSYQNIYSGKIMANKGIIGIVPDIYMYNKGNFIPV